jgi:hypothetical protein
LRLTRLALSLFLLLAVVGNHASIAIAAQRGAPQAVKEVSGRVIIEGLPSPRFSLLALSPGRPANTAAVNPQADGTFKTTLPLGLSVVGAAQGLPAGFTIRSMTYGPTDLMRDPVNVATTDTAELVIALSAPRAGSISGKVTGLRSNSGVRVVLRNNTPGVSWEAPVNADGTFIITKVVPGTYSLRVSYGGLVTARSVTLADQDLTGMDLGVSPERVFIGHVHVETGNAPELALEARSATGAAVLSRVGSPSGGADPARTFRLRLTDGEYRISIPNVPAGYRVQSATYGAIDLLKDPLKVDGLGLWEIVVRLVPAR